MPPEFLVQPLFLSANF